MSSMSVRKLRAGDQIFWNGAVHTVHGVTTNRVNEAVDVSLVRSNGEVISYVFPWEGSVALVKEDELSKIKAYNVCTGHRIYHDGEPCYVMDTERRGKRVRITVMQKGVKRELNTDFDYCYELVPATPNTDLLKVEPLQFDDSVPPSKNHVRGRYISRGNRIVIDGKECHVLYAVRDDDRRTTTLRVDRDGLPVSLTVGYGAWVELTPSTPDAVEDVKNQPHYTEGGIEPIEYMRAKLTPEQFEGFVLGNAIKYLSRARLKGEREKDYAKALWYVQVLNGQDPRKESKP